MNTYVTAQQMRRIDAAAINKFGIPSIVLMENAGRSVADIILKILNKKNCRKVCFFCGKGNNGGDGLVAARYLLNADVGASVFILADFSELKNDTLINFNILRKLSASIFSITTIKEFDKIKQGLKEYNCLVDAIFGTGLNSVINGYIRPVIQYINKLNVPIVSIDIPSGLDATDGRILGAAVRADKTVSFCLPKKGFIKNSGPRCTGEISIYDIGIPFAAVRQVLKI